MATDRNDRIASPVEFRTAGATPSELRTGNGVCTVGFTQTMGLKGRNAVIATFGQAQIKGTPDAYEARNVVSVNQREEVKRDAQNAY